MIDFDSELGRSALARLELEQVGWLTTTRRDGSPWPNPVWFLWDGSSILVYSAIGSAKNAHVAREPRVTFHLNGEGWSTDINVLSGRAEIADDVPAPDRNEQYLAKYRESIARLGLTVEEYAERYAVPIRIRIETLRGH
jgi:PPOX class probable F420-dependent enzyme